MNELEFTYKMDIDFSSDVFKHCYSLRCVPFDNEFQKIKGITVDITPSNNRTYTTDGFGNTVLTDRITVPHRHFSVYVHGTAQTDITKKQPEKLNGIYKYPSEYTKAGENITEFLSRLPQDFITTPVDTAERLMKEIHKVFSYQSGATSINTTADEALKLGCGVCQDYSHIFISVARTLGIPSRYVAGIQKGTGETHAWAEVYDNGIWTGIDVTNNRMIDDTYLQLSHGRDFADCGINRGLLIGGGTQSQSISAQVKVL